MRRAVPRLVACQPLIVVHAAVVAVPPIRASGNESLAAQPRTSTIAVTVSIVGRPPTESDTDKAVVEVIVVMDEVIVVVVVPITVPVVAMPYRSTVPATTTPSTNIGKMSMIYSADVTFTNMSDTPPPMADPPPMWPIPPPPKWTPPMPPPKPPPRPALALSRAIGIRRRPPQRQPLQRYGFS